MTECVTQFGAAVYCGVSTSTFRYWLRKYPDLKIACYGRGVEGWKISLAELDRWRNKHGILNPAYEETRLQKQFLCEQRTIEQTNYLRLKIDMKRGDFLDKHEVEDRLNTAINFLDNQLFYSPKRMSWKHGLTNEQTVSLTKELEWLREYVIGSLRGILSMRN